MTITKPYPLSYHPEQIAERSNIIDAENAKLDSELAEATRITEHFSDSLPPGGTEAAINAEIRRLALLGLRERTSSNLNYYHQQIASEYFRAESTAVIASAEFELAELVKDFPKTKESFMSRIAATTREALGMKSFDRSEKLAARDKDEETLIHLESCVETARTAISRFRNAPIADNFNGISGAIGMLRHELSEAAKAAV